MLTEKMIEGLEILLGQRPKARDQAALRRSDLAAIAETIAEQALPREGARLPVHASEAAATTAGLKSGAIYRTATGELRIKL